MKRGVLALDVLGRSPDDLPVERNKPRDAYRSEDNLEGYDAEHGPSLVTLDASRYSCGRSVEHVAALLKRPTVRSASAHRTTCREVLPSA